MYIGYSMSFNAADAYESGEKPLSKWNKQNIIDRIFELAYENDIELRVTQKDLKKLTLKELKENFLRYSSWHHTSCRYNCTDFYEVDYNVLEDITRQKIIDIINSRPPKQKKENPKDVKAKVKYKVWGGTRNYPTVKEYEEILSFKSTDKMISTTYGGRKRMSSITIIEYI